MDSEATDAFSSFSQSFTESEATNEFPRHTSSQRSPLKRPRASSPQLPQGLPRSAASHHDSPLSQRTPTSSRLHAKKPLPIPRTNAFMFRGSKPLYSRHIVEDKPDKMEIRCTQLGCTHPYKEIPRALAGTNNYKTHYKQRHPDIPTNEEEERIQQRGTPSIASSARSSFFDKPAYDTNRDTHSRTLLVEWIIKNNLSFSIVEQPETIALFKFVAPAMKLPSRRTLMRDLKEQYKQGALVIQETLRKQVESGGRIALTTDAWAGDNKLDYSAVTAHFRTETGEHKEILLDIIELTNPSHTGEYLCQKLVEITNRFDITTSIISVTRDNASPNQAMLEEFECVAKREWELL